MRNLYHTDGQTDLDKMRQDARKSALGDVRHKPESVVIHLHPYKEECKYGHRIHGVEVQPHEEFFVQETTEESSND